jgi:hypothetical protein
MGVLALVVLIGIVASAAACIVLLRGAFAPKIRLFCIAIVVCDLTILVISYLGTHIMSEAMYVWSRGHFYQSLHLTSEFFCKFRSYMFFTMQFCSNYIVLLLAVER